MTKVLIGKVVATSGIKGYVRVHTDTERPEDLKLFEVVYDSIGNEHILKRIVSTKGSIAVVEIEGISSIEGAQKLIGAELFVDRNSFEELSDDCHYYVDLIGCKVYIENEEYGEVIDVMNYGASDIIEVRERITSKLVMYPFIDDFILEVKVDDKRIILKEKIIS